jgi:hypothetical protein
VLFVVLNLKAALSNEGWDCSLYLIAGQRSVIGQMMKDVSRISLVCSFSIFQARNDPVRSSPHLVTQLIDGMPTEV